MTSGFERRSSRCQSDTLSTPSIVAAFPQSASGDVSPNVLGAFDARAGTACDGSRAERDGGSAGRFAKKKPRVRDCVGRGPPGTEGDRFLSCLVTGTAQAAACVSLLDGAARVSGPVRAAARWVPIGREGGAAAAGDLPGDRAAAADRTATPALGYSFAAGTTDGPGENGFTQGDREHEDDTTEHEKKTKNKQRFLGRVATFLFGGAFGVSKETRVAHAPKPVLVAFRDADEDETETRFPFWKRRFRRNPPLGWVQRDVQVQVFRIGRVLILSVPAEGDHRRGEEAGEGRRRERRAPKRPGVSRFRRGTDVVDGGQRPRERLLGYVTTAEEYAAQRYEGASTLYGPNTLRLYERVVAELVAELVAEREDEAEDETEDETECSYARAPNRARSTKISENLFAASPCRVSCLRSTRGGRRARNSGRWFLARTERDTVRPTPERDTTKCVFASAPAAATGGPRLVSRRKAAKTFFAPSGRRDPRPRRRAFRRASTRVARHRGRRRRVHDRGVGRARPSVARQPPDAELAPAGRHEAGDVPRGRRGRSEDGFERAGFFFREKSPPRGSGNPRGRKPRVLPGFQRAVRSARGKGGGVSSCACELLCASRTSDGVSESFQSATTAMDFRGRGPRTVFDDGARDCLGRRHGADADVSARQRLLHRVYDVHVRERREFGEVFRRERRVPHCGVHGGRHEHGFRSVGEVPRAPHARQQGIAQAVCHLRQRVGAERSDD